MGSIKIKKLGIDHTYSTKKSKDSPPCNHFSIRGYVAKMRQKNENMCLPFLVNNFAAQHSLPPIVVPRFNSWSCDMCREENKLVDLTGDNDENESDHIPNDNKKNDGVQDTVDRATDHDPSFVNNAEVGMQNHRLKNYTYNSSKRRKKTRLLKEIFNENDKSNIEQDIAERLVALNSSNIPKDSKTQANFMDKVVGEGNNKKLTKKGSRGRKRKSPLDEDGKSSKVFFERVENELQTIKLDAANSLTQVAPSEERLGDSVHLSLNNFPRAKNRLILPWSTQKGVSNYQLIRHRDDINSFEERRLPSTSVISRKGKEVLIQETDKTTIEDISDDGMEKSNTPTYINLTTFNEESNQDSLMEVAEIMIKFLPNVENANQSEQNSSHKDKTKETTERMSKYMANVDDVNYNMENTCQKEEPVVNGRKNGTRKCENVFQNPENGISRNKFSFDESLFGKNNLHSTRSPFHIGILPSSRENISPMDTKHRGGDQTSMFDRNSFGINNQYSVQPPFEFGLPPSSKVRGSQMSINQLGPARTSMFNLGIREVRSSNSSLHIQEYGNVTSNLGTPMSLNNALQTPQMITSYHPNNTIDTVFHLSDTLNKRVKVRDFDLNIPYSANSNDQVGTSSKGSMEYLFSSQHNEAKHPNQKASFHLNANDITPNKNLLILDQLPDSHKKSYSTTKSHGPTIFGMKLISPSGLSDPNMTMYENENLNSSCSFMQNRKKPFGWLDQEEETLLQHCGSLNDTFESQCVMNRNPAEFSPIQPGNPYMIDKEDKV